MINIKRKENASSSVAALLVIAILASAIWMVTLGLIPTEAAQKDTPATAEEIYSTIWFWPAPKGKNITSGFNLSTSNEFNLLQASRVKSIGSNYRYHSGVDIGGEFSVRAAKDGVVVKAVGTGSNGGTACYMTIKHTLASGHVAYSTYYHFKSGTLKFKVGETVKAGDILGTSGNTGNSKGVHLHFSIHTTVSTSNNAATMMNVNPKKSLGINSGYSKTTIDGRTYTKADFEAQLFGKSKINYSLDANEVRQLSAFEKGCKRCFYTGLYYIAKATTPRLYPADAAPKANINFSKNQICIAVAEGYNAYNNRWIAVRTLTSDKIIYIYESFLGKRVEPTLKKFTAKTTNQKNNTTKFEITYTATDCSKLKVDVYVNGTKRSTVYLTSSNRSFTTARYGKVTVKVTPMYVTNGHSVSGCVYNYTLRKS